MDSFDIRKYEGTMVHVLNFNGRESFYVDFEIGSSLNEKPEFKTFLMYEIVKAEMQNPGLISDIFSKNDKNVASLTDKGYAFLNKNSEKFVSKYTGLVDKLQFKDSMIVPIDDVTTTTLGKGGAMVVAKKEPESLTSLLEQNTVGSAPAYSLSNGSHSRVDDEYFKGS